MIGVNIGSGQRPFKSVTGFSWLNVDINPSWAPDIIASAHSIPQIDTQSVDVVVLHHMLEHFGLDDGAPVIQEAVRILKPGGRLLVFVPDLKELAAGWMNERIDDYTFFVNVYGAYMGDEADRHKWGYSWPSLSALLTQNGCLGVRRIRTRPELPGADMVMDWWILGAEAVK